MQIKYILHCLSNCTYQTTNFCCQVLRIPYHFILSCVQNSAKDPSTPVSRKFSQGTEHCCLGPLCEKVSNFFTSFFSFQEQRPTQNRRGQKNVLSHIPEIRQERSSSIRSLDQEFKAQETLPLGAALDITPSRYNPISELPLNSAPTSYESWIKMLDSSSAYTPEETLFSTPPPRRLSDQAYTDSDQSEGEGSDEESLYNLDDLISYGKIELRRKTLLEEENSFPSNSIDLGTPVKLLSSYLNIRVEGSPFMSEIQNRLADFTKEQQGRILSVLCLSNEYKNPFLSNRFIEEFIGAVPDENLVQLLSTRLGKTVNLEELRGNLSSFKSYLISVIDSSHFLYAAGFVINKNLFQVICPTEINREELQELIAPLFNNPSLQFLQDNPAIQDFFTVVFEMAVLAEIDSSQRLNVYGSYIQFSSTLPSEWKLPLFSDLKKIPKEQRAIAKTAAPILEDLHQIFKEIETVRPSLEGLGEFYKGIPSVVLLELEKIDFYSRAPVSRSIKASLDNLIEGLSLYASSPDPLAVIRAKYDLPLSNLLGNPSEAEAALKELFATVIQELEDAPDLIDFLD